MSAPIALLDQEHAELKLKMIKLKTPWLDATASLERTKDKSLLGVSLWTRCPGQSSLLKEHKERLGAVGKRRLAMPCSGPCRGCETPLVPTSPLLARKLNSAPILQQHRLVDIRHRVVHDGTIPKAIDVGLQTLMRGAPFDIQDTSGCADCPEKSL